MVADSKQRWAGCCLWNGAACGAAGLGGEPAGRNAFLIKHTGSTFHKLEGMLTCVPGFVCSSEKAVCSPAGVRAVLEPLFRKVRAQLRELLGDTGYGSWLIGEIMFILGAVACQSVV